MNNSILLKFINNFEKWLQYQLDLTPRNFNNELSESSFNWNKGYRKALRDIMYYLKQEKNKIGQDG